MAGNGRLIDSGNGYATWAIDDFISLYYNDPLQSPTFKYQSVPFNIELSINSQEDRLQLYVISKIIPTERYQVSLVMDTGKNGRLESRSGIIDISQRFFFVRRWMPWKEMLSRRLEILSDGVLKVRCTIRSFERPTTRRVTSPEDENATEERTSSDHYEKLRTDIEREGVREENEEDTDYERKTLKRLQKDLNNLFKSGEDCDVTIKVQNKEFPAHRNILRSRSPVFKSMFSHETLEKLSGVVVIDDCDPGTFPDFLNYLYTGSTKHISEKNVCRLFTASDKYQVEELKEGCSEFMKSHLSVETFCDFITLALMHTEQELIDLATEFFSANTLEIVKTAKWQIFLKENLTAGNELFIKSLSK